MVLARPALSKGNQPTDGGNLERKRPQQIPAVPLRRARNDLQPDVLQRLHRKQILPDHQPTGRRHPDQEQR